MSVTLKPFFECVPARSGGGAGEVEKSFVPEILGCKFSDLLVVGTHRAIRFPGQRGDQRGNAHAPFAKLFEIY